MKVDFVIFTGVGGETEESNGSSQKTWRSVGPSKIANRLRSAGYTVQIINFATHFNYEELKLMSEKFINSNTIIGISTTFLFGNNLTQKKTTALEEIVAEYKSKYNCKILLGGPSPEFYKDKFNPDILIHGFAENKILEIANQLKNNGISKTLTESWNILTCNHKWHPSDLIQTKETLPLEIGRGCIFTCKYCKFEYLGKKRGEYVRDFSLIRDEIIENHELYQVSNYMLMDDTFNDDVHKMEEWCKMVDSLPFTIKYTTYCRGDLLWSHQDIARELYRTGMHGTTIGIETMNMKAAKVIGKTWSAKHARDFIPYWVHDICQGKTLTQLNFIAGLPGDTLDDMWSWINWSKENCIPTIRTNALMITNPKFYPNEASYSDFDRNAEEKYGYRFPNKRLPLAWENDQMTWFEAKRANKEMWKYIANNFSDSAWCGFAAMSLGYTLEEILSMSDKELYTSEEYLRRNKDWFETYKLKLITL